MDIYDIFLIGLLSIGEFRLKDFVLFLWNTPFISYVIFFIGSIILLEWGGNPNRALEPALWGLGMCLGSIIFAIYWTVQFGYV